MALAATCDDPGSKVPTAPGEPTITALEISGPNSIAPGQTVQFHAVTRLSDGTSKIGNNLASLRWQSSQPALLQIDQSGVATARQGTGQATVSVDLGSPQTLMRSTREVAILPDGTYRLVGKVGEIEFPDAPVAGARVEVNPGSLVATTDPGGLYQLFGVPPDAEIRVTAIGYQPHVERLLLAGHATRDFRLALSGRRLTLNGAYTLAIELTGACLGRRLLPTDLQRRSYDADVTQNGSDIVVRLTEPRFRLEGQRGNQFAGRADAVGASFILQPFSTYYYYYYSPYPDVVERLSNGSYLIPSGQVATTGSASRLSGEMRGEISNWDSRFPDFSSQLVGSCSSSFRFTLTRR